MPRIQKDSINPHFKNRYVSLDKVLEVVLPVLHKHGLLLLQPPASDHGTPMLTTCIVDTETGERIEHSMPLILERETPQGIGSSITYARRYSLLSLLGLTADEDDDGEAAEPVTRGSTDSKAAARF